MIFLNLEICIFCFSGTHLRYFIPIAKLFLPFSLHYHRIWSIVSQALPVSEELSEIQRADFEPKEQFAPQPSPRKFVCMVIPPQTRWQGFNTIAEPGVIRTLLSPHHPLCFCTVDGGKGQNKYGNTLPLVCRALFPVWAVSTAHRWKCHPHLSIFVWPAVRDGFYAARTRKDCFPIVR